MPAVAALALGVAGVFLTPQAHAIDRPGWLGGHTGVRVATGLEREDVEGLFQATILGELRRAGADKTASKLAEGKRWIALASRERITGESFRDNVVEGAAEALKVLDATTGLVPVPAAQASVKAVSKSVGYAATQRSAAARLMIYHDKAVDADGLPTRRGIIRAVYAAYRSVELEDDTAQGKFAAPTTRAPGGHRALFRPANIWQRAFTKLGLRVHESDAIARLYAAQFGHTLLREARSDEERAEIRETIHEMVHADPANVRTARLTRGLYAQLEAALSDPTVAAARRASFKQTRRAHYTRMVQARSAAGVELSRDDRVKLIRAAGTRAAVESGPWSVESLTAGDASRALRATSLRQRAANRIARWRAASARDAHGTREPGRHAARR